MHSRARCLLRAVRAATRARAASSKCEDPPPPPPPPDDSIYTARYNYHPEIEVLINMQIQAEQQAALNYLGMATHFARAEVARPGCHGFFMKMYHEETGHMLDFVRYQLYRGGVVSLSNLDAPKANEELTLLNAFKTALIMEHGVTDKLRKIVSEAVAVNDVQCADFVTARFLTEQMQSMSTLAGLVARVQRILGDEAAIYLFDDNLLKQYPYTITNTK